MKKTIAVTVFLVLVAATSWAGITQAQKDDLTAKVNALQSAIGALVVDVPLPPPPPPPPASLGTVTDLKVTAITTTSVTLTFTEVPDGAGGAANYTLRYSVSPISWGNAFSTETVLPGGTVGAVRTLAVSGLTAATSYQFQMIAYRGVLNTTGVVFSPLSNIASALTIASVPTPPPPPAGAIAFESSWDTALGSSTAALTDGGAWPVMTQWDNPPAPVLTVVTGGPLGHNALRVQQHGPFFPSQVGKLNYVPQGTSYYLRFYFKTDDTSSAGDHIAQVGGTVSIPPGDNLTFIRKYGGPSTWRLAVSLYGCGDPLGYPMEHWSPGPRLANGQWYRLEYFVEFVDTTHVRVHPRVYDAAGNLLYSDADFRQEDYQNGGVWNGRSDWTFASFYAAGHSFCVDPVAMNDLGLGNNGNAGASDTGLYWYFSGVQVRTDTWPGPTH